jgi:hypothetical protein
MPKPTSGVQIMSFWGPNRIITKSLASMRAAIVEHGIGGDRGKCAGERTRTRAGPAPPAAAEPQPPLPMMQIAAFEPGRAPPREPARRRNRPDPGPDGGSDLTRRRRRPMQSR